jgi:hypothetical protein
MKRCISAKFSFESGADQPLKIKLLLNDDDNNNNNNNIDKHSDNNK